MEPVLVEVDKQGKVEAYDAAGLFQQGQNALESQDWAQCDTSFERLIAKFPQSRYTHAAFYNRGLCLEHLRLHTLAGDVFQRYAYLSAEEKDKLDGLFRLGFNLVRSKQYARAAPLYDKLLQHDLLGPADKAECYLRRGTARLHLKRYGMAEKDLKLAMALITEAYEGITRGSDLLAEAHFRRGEVYQHLSQNVKLKLPVSRMKGDLRDKSRFFRQSQASYIDAVNVRNAYWATAAGLRLGEIYEQFYRDVLSAEAPHLSKKERTYYQTELRRQLHPLLEESLTIYETNITMSQRIGAENEWVKETEVRVQRLRALIEENAKAAKAMDDADTKSKKRPKTRAKRPRRG
jgi:tetratricopeptide (TPR) repeat protein